MQQQWLLGNGNVRGAGTERAGRSVVYVHIAMNYNNTAVVSNGKLVTTSDESRTKLSNVISASTIITHYIALVYHHRRSQCNNA